MMEKPKRKHVGAYEVGETLGQGAFGKVKLGTNIFSGEKVAIKIISAAGSRTTKEVLQLERERNILLKLSHPNIVNLLKVVDDPARNRCYMIFEYVEGGELFDYIVNHGRLCEKDARKFMRQIISAVEYCHSMLVIHRDLKPENLLLDGNLNIKITDFGLSNIMEPGKRFSTFCGSLHYACPEILQGKEYLGPGVDIWAMGIILYCLVVGRQPWDGANAEELISTILDDGLEIPDSISDNCVDLILQMLRVKEDDRIPIPEMRFHPWILEGWDAPPPSFLPSVEPIQTINQTVLDQMLLMGIITIDNIELVKSALLKGDKENQVICIYHLLHQQQQESLRQKKEVKPRLKPKKQLVERLTPEGPSPRTRSQSVSVPQRKDQVGRKEQEEALGGPVRKKTRERRVSDRGGSTDSSPPDTPKYPTDIIEPPPSSPVRKTTSSSRKKMTVVTIPRPGTPTALFESSSPPGDRHSMSLSSSPVNLSPVVAPRRKSVLTESAPAERFRSVSAAPKPNVAPKKVVTERNASPSKKHDRPILALGDISSGKIKQSSRPSSPVNQQSPSKSPSPQKSQDTSRGKPPRKTLNDIFKEMPRTASDDSEIRARADAVRTPPPEEDEQKNLPFELKTKLISSLNPTQLKDEVERSLKSLSLTYKKKGDSKFKCETKIEDSSITFSIEIIKTDKHNLALKIKRLGGSGFGYKIVHERLVQEFNLHY